MASQPSVLLACNDCKSRSALGGILAGFGLELVFASSVKQARASLLERPIDLVVCEATLTDGSFRDVLHILNLAGSRVPLVVCSLLGEIDEYLEAMELGAFDFIAPPFRPVELELIVNTVLGKSFSTDHKRAAANPANLGWEKERKAAS